MFIKVRLTQIPYPSWIQEVFVQNGGSGSSNPELEENPAWLSGERIGFFVWLLIFQSSFEANDVEHCTKASIFTDGQETEQCL